VAFDAGGIADWLEDGENGRLIDPALGAHGLGDAITDILRDPDLRRRLGTGARAAAARLSLDAHLRALTTVLRQAAAVTAAVS
jgi:glycosyltransferase involved in cell wall biosynthesis